MVTAKKLRSLVTFRRIRQLAQPFLVLAAIVVPGCIALKHPTATWTTLAVSAAALIPLGMIVVGRYGCPLRRPLRYGFAICCGGYFLFFTFFSDSPYLENLATAKSIDLLYKHMFPTSLASPLPSMKYYSGGGFGGGGGAFDVPDPGSSDGSPGTGKDADSTDPFAAGSLADADSADSAAMTDPAKLAQKQQDDSAAAQSFWLTGHALWALLLGWAGGCAAQLLAIRQMGRQDSTKLGAAVGLNASPV